MIVNGEKKLLSDLSSPLLPELLKELKLSPDRVAVEINGRVLKKVEILNQKLFDDDVIEIIHFVGGGSGV